MDDVLYVRLWRAMAAIVKDGEQARVLTCTQSHLLFRRHHDKVVVLVIRLSLTEQSIGTSIPITAIFEVEKSKVSFGECTQQERKLRGCSDD